MSKDCSTLEKLLPDVQRLLYPAKPSTRCPKIGLPNPWIFVLIVWVRRQVCCGVWFICSYHSLLDEFIHLMSTRWKSPPSPGCTAMDGLLSSSCLARKVAVAYAVYNDISQPALMSEAAVILLRTNLLPIHHFRTILLLTECPANQKFLP